MKNFKLEAIDSDHMKITVKGALSIDLDQREAVELCYRLWHCLDHMMEEEMKQLVHKKNYKYPPVEIF